jgi:hypothetical protein
MTFCYFDGKPATVAVQVDPDEPADKRPACATCAERIKKMHYKYKIVPLDNSVRSVVEEPDPED